MVHSAPAGIDGAAGAAGLGASDFEFAFAFGFASATAAGSVLPDASVVAAEGSRAGVGPFAHDAAATHNPSAIKTYFFIIGNVSMRASTVPPFYQRGGENAPVRGDDEIRPQRRRGG